MAMVSKARGTSIRLYLADGRADGFRLVEKSNWTGLGLVSSRADYSRVRLRDEYRKPGVYLLVAPAGNGLRQQLYVGEADDVRERVDQHQVSKDFWTSVIAFTSKDDNLNKAHVRYLESRLIELAKKANRCRLQNDAVPRLSKLSEADRADMEAYLDEMLVILPLLGIDAFQELDAAVSSTKKLYLRMRDTEAIGADTSEGFLVYEGSSARSEHRPSAQAWLQAIRKQLLEEDILVPDGGNLKFTRKYLFNSASTAAGVVVGGSVNGRTAWRTEAGQTLKQLQESALDVGPQ